MLRQGYVLKGTAADRDLLSAISGCSCVIAASESAEAVSVPLKDDNRGVNSGMVTIDNN